MNIFAYAVLVWIPSYLVRSHDMSIIDVGLWYGVPSALGGIIGSILSGIIVDRLAVKDPKFQLLVPAMGFLVAGPLYMMQMLWPSNWIWIVGDSCM